MLAFWLDGWSAAAHSSVVVWRVLAVPTSQVDRLTTAIDSRSGSATSWSATIRG